MTPLEWILGTLFVTTVTGVIAHHMGSTNKVTEKTCKDHRETCSKNLNERLGRIEKSIDSIFKILNEKLMGIPKK